MTKICVICGAQYKAPPSSKKVTCSQACRSRRAAEAARRGRKWSSEAKQRRANNPYVMSQMASIQTVGAAAAMAIPEGQRGPQNRGSKIWTLIDPSGNKIVVTNLLDWARNNYTLFEPPCDDVDAAAGRVAKGFMAIASSMRCVKSRQRPVYHYKGWSLDGLPESSKK